MDNSSQPQASTKATTRFSLESGFSQQPTLGEARPHVTTDTKPKSRLSRFFSKLQSPAVRKGAEFHKKDKEEEALTGVKKKDNSPNPYGAQLVDDFRRIIAKCGKTGGAGFTSFNAVTGEQMEHKVPENLSSRGGKIVGIARGDMRRVFAEGCEDHIEWSRHVTGYELTDDGVKAVFADGTTSIEGAMLVGGEGIYSKPGVIRAPNDDYSIVGKKAADLVWALTKDWHPRFKPLFDDMDEEEAAFWKITCSTLLGVPEWPNEPRVTVIGDAVHSMTPAGGIGANTAPGVTAAYEKEMRVYASEAVHTSYTTAVGQFGIKIDEATSATV
ncbi:hypothetical protein OQA88_1242 [Cercophora sp. LCS_1]